MHNGVFHAILPNALQTSQGSSTAGPSASLIGFSTPDLGPQTQIVPCVVCKDQATVVTSTACGHVGCELVGVLLVVL